MYRTDAATGKTKFELARPTRTVEVFLECFRAQEKFRVPMIRERTRWIARLALPPGWFFYRFHVDGRPRWDGDSGTVRTGDGARCSLAIINHCHLARA